MYQTIKNMRRALFARSNEHNDEITHYPMATLTMVAITARIYYLIVIDLPLTENAGWLSALLGAAMASPAILACYLCMKVKGKHLLSCLTDSFGEIGLRLLACAVSFCLTFETAALFTILTSSGAYATLYNMHKLLLLVPTSLAVLYACMKGGNGIGAASEVWIRIYALLYLVILYLEYATANFSYVFPILGPGKEVLFASAMKVSGYYALLPISYLIETGFIVKGRNEKTQVKSESILFLFLGTVLISVILLLFHSAMYPSVYPVVNTRAFRMDMLLSNGRSNRTVQLPILIIWFSSLAFSAGYMLYCAGRLMNIALKEKGKKCIFLLGMISLVLALFRAPDQARAVAFSGIAGPALCGVFLLYPVCSMIRRK